MNLMRNVGIPAALIGGVAVANGYVDVETVQKVFGDGEQRQPANSQVEERREEFRRKGSGLANRIQDIGIIDSALKSKLLLNDIKHAAHKIKGTEISDTMKFQGESGELSVRISKASDSAKPILEILIFGDDSETKDTVSFVLNSEGSSADYVLAKDGEISQILDPDLLDAINEGLN